MKENLLEKGSIVRVEAFKIINEIKAIAQKYNPDGYIDMSRGDPCYPPSVLADEVFVFFQIVKNYVQDQLKGKSVISGLGFSEIAEAYNKAKKIYKKEIVEKADEILKEIEKLLPGKTVEDLWIDLVRGFQSSGYGDIAGEIEVRAVVAHYLKEKLGLKHIDKEDIILTLGAAEAIGKIFDLFGDKYMLHYLSDKDYVATLSPVYGPYNAIISYAKLPLKLLPLSVSQRNNFLPEESEIDRFENEAKTKKPRLLILVNPSNPTGRVYDEKTLERLAEIFQNIEIPGYECKGSIIIEDIVYADFLPDKFISISNFAPCNTIIIGSMSKFFRATGNRLGYIVIPKETDDFLKKFFSWSIKFSPILNRIVKYKPDYSFKDLLCLVKSPDPVGALSHTHLVPKIAQYLGMIRLLIDDGKEYLNTMREKWETFYSGIDYWPFDISEKDNFVPYYCLVDFKDLILQKRDSYPILCSKINENKIEPEELISLLAKNGLVGLPAATFYKEAKEKHKWTVRFSVANVEIEHVEKACEIIKRSLNELN